MACWLWKHVKTNVFMMCLFLGETSAMFFLGNMLLSPNVEEFGHHFPHLGLNLVPTKMKIALEHSPKVQGYMGKTTIVCWKWGYSISIYFFWSGNGTANFQHYFCPSNWTWRVHSAGASWWTQRFCRIPSILTQLLDSKRISGSFTFINTLYIYTVYIYIYQGNTIAAKIKHGHNILWPTDPTPCGPRALQSDWSRKVP